MNVSIPLWVSPATLRVASYLTCENRLIHRDVDAGWREEAE
jgi:hypothetical protein